jgi:hypothetical protein
LGSTALEANQVALTITVSVAVAFALSQREFIAGTSIVTHDNERRQVTAHRAGGTRSTVVLLNPHLTVGKESQSTEEGNDKGDSQGSNRGRLHRRYTKEQTVTDKYTN